MKAGLRIAVADDEPDMREYFEKCLKRLGYQVVAVAENGRDLVEACRQTQPDLVIKASFWIADCRLRIDNVEVEPRLACDNWVRTESKWSSQWACSRAGAQDLRGRRRLNDALRPLRGRWSMADKRGGE